MEIESDFSGDLMRFIVIQWDIKGTYPLVNCPIAMENHHFEWVSEL
jgi:hypothetical protein